MSPVDDELDLKSLKLLPDTFFDGDDVDEIARQLIGTILIFKEGEAGNVGGLIVETEAYSENDPTAHCYSPIIAGGDAMRNAGGHAYIFSASYGYCLNFVTGNDRTGSAVLIRALRPMHGKQVMRLRRGPYAPKALGDQSLLCPGPVALCEALGITDRHNKLSLFASPFRLYQRLDGNEPQLLSGPRIGVEQTIKKHRRHLHGSDLADKAVAAPKRWVDKDNKTFTRSEHRSSLRTAN